MWGLLILKIIQTVCCKLTGDLSVKHIIGGYYLVEGIRLPGEFLPQPFWTVSSCICAIYPAEWALSWVPGSIDDRERRRLGLTDIEFRSMQRWVDALTVGGRFGWPNVCMDIDTAREYYQRYLSPSEEIKLFAIALPEKYLNELSDIFRSDANRGAKGVYQMLCRNIPLTGDGIQRGYDILGYRQEGTFHSFACNFLEKDYQTKLGIELNSFGLIDSLDAAEKAAQYAMLKAIQTEPVLWLPWLVIEYPILRAFRRPCAYS